MRFFCLPNENWICGCDGIVTDGIIFGVNNCDNHGKIVGSSMGYTLGRMIITCDINKSFHLAVMG